jgi:hypothetical protein
MGEKIARVVYRFDESNATYDFVSWLAIVERARLQSPIEKFILALVPGRRYRSERDMAYRAERHTWRMTELIPALAGLLPSCIAVVQGDAATDKQVFPYTIMPYAFGAYLEGPAYLQALLPFSEPYITLTVRQSWFQPGRDTQLLWNELIPQLGLPVVVIPDTEAEMDGKACGITAGQRYTAAAFNPRLRFALYEKARLNLFTSGGPMLLALFSDLKAELFGLCVPGHPTCSPPHLTAAGLTDGRQIQNSRLQWDADADTILNAVKERV